MQSMCFDRTHKTSISMEKKILQEYMISTATATATGLFFTISNSEFTFFCKITVFQNISAINQGLSCLKGPNNGSQVPMAPLTSRCKY